MQPTDRASRLKYARERAGFDSPRAAARHFRWNENTYKAREGGMRDFGVEEAIEYGRAFHVSWVWLASGEGSCNKTRTLTIGGLIISDGEVDPNVAHYLPDDMTAIDLDWALPGDAEAFQIYGNSMLPKFDPGDVVITRNTNAPADMFLGEYVLATCSDSRRYLRRIQRGYTPNDYDLETYNAPTIKGAQVSQIGLIVLVAPGRRLRHHSSFSLKNNDHRTQTGHQSSK